MQKEGVREQREGRMASGWETQWYLGRSCSQPVSHSWEWLMRWSSPPFPTTTRWAVRVGGDCGLGFSCSLGWWRGRLLLDYFCCSQQCLHLLSFSTASWAPSLVSLPSAPRYTSEKRPKTGRMLQIPGTLKATFLFEAGLFFQPFPICKLVSMIGISLILSLAKGGRRTCHHFSFQNSIMKRFLPKLLNAWGRNDASHLGVEVPLVCPSY